MYSSIVETWKVELQVVLAYIITSIHVPFYNPCFIILIASVPFGFWIVMCNICYCEIDNIYLRYIWHFDLLI